MTRYKKNKVKFLLLFVAMVIISVSSCKDDEVEENILHRSYIQGSLNNHDVAISDVNANIMIDKSDYQFSSGNQTDIPAWFDWEVKLIDTKDTCITLYLHIDDVKKTNEIIYSPNNIDVIKTLSTCYATVWDLKNNTTSIYHPTHQSPINLVWKTFMMTVDNEYKNLTKQYDYEMKFAGHRWPGIEGKLEGLLTSDDESKSPLRINMKFTLF